MVRPTIPSMVAWGFAAALILIGLVDAWAFHSTFGIDWDKTMIGTGAGIGIGQALPALGGVVVAAVRTRRVS